MTRPPTAWSTFLDFARLGRPQFLVGGFFMHALGAAIARYDGATFDLVAFVWGQLAVTTIQLMTHYGNEYFDLAADRANPTPTRWAGGSRVLVEGRIDPRVALIAAIALAALALKCALVLAVVVRPGLATFLLFAIPLVLAWSYSAPPLKLHSRGLGELTTALLVPGMGTLAGFWLQAGRFEPLPLLIAAPLVLLQFGMLLLIELPDRVGDSVVGKNTLVVRLGPERSAQLYLGTLAGAYLLVVAFAGLEVPPPLLTVQVLPLPLAICLGSLVARGAWKDSAYWDNLSFMGIALLIGTAALDLFAFILLETS